MLMVRNNVRKVKFNHVSKLTCFSKVISKLSLTAQKSCHTVSMIAGLSDWLANTDLIKITSQPAKLSAVHHKIAMEMTPEGSQTTAITGAQPLHLTYKVDRPFLFLVRDEPTGAVLFIGRVLNPQ